MVNFFATIFISQVAIHLTHLLALKPSFGPVRASALSTLLFIGMTSAFTLDLIPALQTAFLGASFIGMSDSQRLSRLHLTVAGLIYSFAFQFLIFHLKGFGGALGFSAFSSCLITYFLFKKAPRFVFTK